jgi:predicted naringenin-chalcone synthase
MTCAIAGIGTAVPETTINQQEGLAMARSLGCPTVEQDTWLPAMYAGTQIDQRRSALPPQLVRDVIEGTRRSGSVFLPTGEPTDRGPSTAVRVRHYAELAPPLAERAARGALASSGQQAGAITHLITVSCTGFFAPGLDRLLVERLGLPATVERTHVGFMGCHGALNGLRLARAFTAADPEARVLLCAVELCSLHYHYSWNPQKMIANAIFADGAAAVVAVPPGLAPAGAWRVAASGSCYLPDSAEAMTWTIGDHGFEMTLARNVPALINRHLRPWLTAWLDRLGVGLAGVRSWAIHPGGPRILSAAEEALGLSPVQTAAAHEVFAEYGNMSSPTILFILDRLMRQGAPRPCLALGFGPGLVVEAALMG